MASGRFLFVSVIALLSCFCGKTQAVGESCSNPDTTIPAVIPTNGYVAHSVTINPTASAVSIGSIPVCSPAIDASETNGTYWFKWLPTQDQTVFFTLTGPNNSTGGPTNFPARLSIVRNSVSSCSTLASSTGTCLLRVDDMCQGYPGTKLPSSIKVLTGQNILIVIDSPKGTTGPQTFQLSIIPSPVHFSETFDLKALPAGWTQSSAPISGNYTANTTGWLYGTGAEVSKNPELVFPPAPSGPFAAINPYLDCANGTKSPDTCDQTLDYLTTPNITFSGTPSAILSFDTYFFDGFTLTHQVVEHIAIIQISSAQNSTWGTLFKVPSAQDQWVTYTVSLDKWAAANDTIRLRFWSDSLNSNRPGATITGWAIDNIQVVNSIFDMCDDGFGCTDDTCSAASFGCINTPKDSICTGLHANCESSVCKPFDVKADSFGCSTSINVTYCDDGKSCSNDTCNPALNPTGNGCVYVEIFGVCDDGLGCTQDICILDPSNHTGDAAGCIFPTSCDDGIRCTTDECITVFDSSTNTSKDYCQHTIDVFSCDDGIDCTYELLCEVERSTLEESGCIIVPMDAWCDDGDPCTIDRCDWSLGLKDSCTHELTNCDDEIACTLDYCNITSGSCWHVPVDAYCDDFIACTEDVCDITLGKCVNVPHDDWCAAENCYLPVCDPAGSGDFPNNHTEEEFGCVYRLVVCNDDIACTNDFCDITNGRCVFQANHTHCADWSNCTDDMCDVSLGRCTNIPNDDNCDDHDACTTDTCGADGVCVFTPIDCSDDIKCTHDYCVAGICHHDLNHTVCNDGFGCTADICDYNRGCINLNNDSYCFTDLCKIETCNPLASGAADGCVREPVLCQDEMACTVNSCNSTNGKCVFTPSNALCNDGLSCTVDVCDVSLGRCTNTPSDALCNDNDPCTADVCGCDGVCDHVEKDCDDDVSCTVDTCNSTTGSCDYTPEDSLCDDLIRCTDDHCDPIRGCSNIPNDVHCDDGHWCTEDVCDPATGGCVWIPDDYLCDDQVFCTLDTCTHSDGCLHDARSDLCDDGNECTQDWCDKSKDCQHLPTDAWCDDFVACTIDTCGEEGCEHTPDDSLCDDGIDCTWDYCDAWAGKCVHKEVDEKCSDGIGCTLDKCSADSGCLPPLAIHDWCEDGFDCSIDICNESIGCTVDFSECPWGALDDDDQICLNCLSTGAAIQELCYEDGKGALQLQTNNGEDGLMTNIFASPFGPVVVNADNQEDFRIAADDGLVVNGNIRVTPVEELPECNEVRRGLIVVQTEEVPCGKDDLLTCEQDVLYICLLEQNYEWREVSFSDDY